MIDSSSFVIKADVVYCFVIHAIDEEDECQILYIILQFTCMYYCACYPLLIDYIVTSIQEITYNYVRYKIVTQGLWWLLIL